MSIGPVPRAVRTAVYARDGWRCVSCGSARELTLNHRASRGMGGSSRPEVHRMSNLVTACWRENTLWESDAAAAEQARMDGFKIRRDEDPLSVPILVNGRRWLLGDDGSLTVWNGDTA